MKFFGSVPSLLLLLASPPPAFASNIRGGEVLEEGYEKQIPLRKAGRRFLEWNEVPEELQEHPEEVLGVIFKEGKKPLALEDHGDQTILDLDGNVVDLKELKPLNVFSPDYYTLSADGTFVTDKLTGETIQIEVYSNGLEDSDIWITASKDDEGNFAEVIIEYDATDKPTQSFKKTGGIYLGFTEDDLEDPTGGHQDYDSQVMTENDENNPNGRSLVTKSYTEDCPAGLYVVRVAISVDNAFLDTCREYYKPCMVCAPYCTKKYGFDQAQYFFSVAKHIYRKSACVDLNLVRLDRVMDSYPAKAVDKLEEWRENREVSTFDHINRDAWHLFTGIGFSDPFAFAGGRGICNYPYGVIDMAYNKDYYWLGKAFARALGSNLGAGQTENDNDLMKSDWLNMGNYLAPENKDKIANTLSKSCRV